MTDQSFYRVGDVLLSGEEWDFALYCGNDETPIVFAFRSRKDANVSRRLLKEIVTRTVGHTPLQKQTPRAVVMSGRIDRPDDDSRDQAR